MKGMHYAILAFAWLLALAWLTKLAEAVRGLPAIPNLAGPKYDVTAPGDPALTVIVPARNEAANVAATLCALLAQDCPNLRIVAVDDRSTDGTGGQIGSLARTHPGRITALHIAALPEGWLGKTHAMALAAREAIASHHADYLLFTDADILFDRTVLRRAIAYAEASRADHLVVLPTTVIETPGEAAILSFLQVISLFVVRPWAIANPRARDAIGVGAFNMVRTSAYLQLGGYEAMPLEVLDDLALGRRVKSAGLRQRVATAPGMVSVHWAQGLFGIVNNMTKNLFAVFAFRPVRLLAAAASISAFCVAPAVLLATPGLRLPGLVAWLAGAGLYTLSSRRSRIPPWNAVFLPVAAMLISWSMLRSMAVTLARGGVTWRGTFYSLAALRRHESAARGKPLF
jgi:GT2 family glycosyltransferase